MGRKEMSAEMEWWLCEPEDDRKLIDLISNLTINEQAMVTKRLRNLSEQTPAFEYKKSPSLDLPPTVP